MIGAGKSRLFIITSTRLFSAGHSHAQAEQIGILLTINIFNIFVY